VVAQGFKKVWRWCAVGVATSVVLTAATVATPSAQAIDFSPSTPGGTDIKMPAGIANGSTRACPTLATVPRSVDAWLNVDDRAARGNSDTVAEPWDFYKKAAQVICGASNNSEIKMGMYFIRAIGTITQPGLDSLDASGHFPDGTLGSRPETDPEVVWSALEYVSKERGVKIGIVVDDTDIGSSSIWGQLTKRLLTLAKFTGFYLPNGSRVSGLAYCKNGCFNINAASVHPTAINHEKFVTISDTYWDQAAGSTTAGTTIPQNVANSAIPTARPAALAQPAVLSSSGNFARSQIRSYTQDMTVIYGDRTLWSWFSSRYDGMAYCGLTGCGSNAGFPTQLKNSLRLQNGIWIDAANPHGTDANRGTWLTFSPQSSTVTDPYITAFNNVDCTVNNQIRISMFLMTDGRAEQMAAALADLSKRGCDVQILLTQNGGSYSISPTVVKTLNSANISARCTAIAAHTKLILIGPATNDNGMIMTGTANMSVSGLRYSEEHTITFDARRASTSSNGPNYQADIRRMYGVYLKAWYQLNATSKTCK